MAEQPHFYAQGRRVHKRSIDRPAVDGKTHFSVDWPICDLTEYGRDDLAAFIAEAMNERVGTPEPWRRTPAQQVQDLHEEVHRWRERAREATALLARAVAMRAAQRAYFADRSCEKLVASKTAERAFDQAAKALGIGAPS